VTLCVLVPQRSWVGKKFIKNFLHPPGRLRPPRRGGSARPPPTPRGPPSPRPDPKKGVAPPPRNFGEKRRKKGVKYARNGVFGGKNGHFRAKFALFLTFLKSDRGAMQAKKGPSSPPVRWGKTRQFIQY
jgi:hypothetical protein